MPKFFFDTSIRGEVHRDEDGEDYVDAFAAIQDAHEGAAQYVADLVARGATPDHEEKLVRSESGEIVARFMILEAFEFALPAKS